MVFSILARTSSGIHRRNLASGKITKSASSVTNSVTTGHAGHRTVATEGVATLLDVGTAVYGEGHS
jgi:hypothetical protein